MCRGLDTGAAIRPALTADESALASEARKPLRF